MKFQIVESHVNVATHITYQSYVWFKKRKVLQKAKNILKKNKFFMFDFIIKKI